MDTQSSTDLKKILETMEADKREMAQQMKTMQEQIQELIVSQSQGEDSNSSGSVNKGGQSGWHPNDIKVDIPEYDGKLDPDEFVEWLRTVERVFDYKNTTEENKVKIFALKLRKYASTWWSNTCLKRERAGKDKIQTWPKMKTKMKQKFLSTYYIQKSFSQLHALKQGSGTAEEYSREFEYLLMKCDVPEDDPQTLVRYLEGLEPRVANVVELHSYQTLSELTLLSHKVDSQQRAKGKFESNPSTFKPTTYSKPTITPKSIPTTQSKPSKVPNSDSTPPKAPPTLFSMPRTGHIASECPNKRIISLADFESAGGFEFESEFTTILAIPSEEEVEVTGPDEGQCLVVRRALSTTLVQEDSLQCESIFHTRCTIAKKVCSVIIDGGSCTNVASQTLVAKLNLTTQPHPTPYVIQWLNQGKGIRVSHRVLLSFSIGKSYVDELWCDVIPMDACHVLLGRPWSSSKRSIQHKIDFIPGASLPNKPAYRSNPQETIEIRKQVDKLLEKGLIRESLSPCAVPTLLVPKKNGEWRMCMDSRSINKITIKYRFPIPRLNDLLDELHGSTVFSKIDLRSGYHQIRIYEGDEWKTAFKTKEGLYEWLVMPFGLSNAPSTFMRLMNHVLKPFLGSFVVVYFDDILVYSRTTEAHQCHLSQLFKVLDHEKLYGNLEKCEFFTNKVTFLGYLVSEQGIQVDEKKIQAIRDWPTPQSIQQVRSFHGLASFYRRFIKNFSTIVAPKTEHYLVSKEFILHSDHEALKYIQGQYKLQPRHAKWVEFLQAFTFTIKHKSGKLNKGADALSRKFSLLNSLQPRVLGFELLQNEYSMDPDFGDIYTSCKNHAQGEFHVFKGFLFKQQQLCIPRHSV
uniref:uncharacterized protein LOC122604740 n=1 Tax=Erigeron canadensis TaxID=72917 RepID=UPI001CB9A492|nr:uncharacterized protein LOC122604740 [Erigeron canadensis]